MSFVPKKPKYSIIHRNSPSPSSFGSEVLFALNAKQMSFKIYILPGEVYASAQCYLATNQLENAIDALQRLQGSYTLIFGTPPDRARVLAKSFYLLGKVYEKKGDKNRATESYQELLKLWKDADKDIPELVDAKARVAKLRAVTTK